MHQHNPFYTSYIIAVLLFISLFNYSQTTAKDFGFTMDFKNAGGKKRYLYSSVPFNTKIENGQLHLAHTKEAKSYFISEFTYIDYKTDFNISTTFKLQHGVKASTYGVLFGANGISNAYIFIINDFGQYYFFKYKNDVIETIKDWTTTDNLKQKGELNTLTIKGENGNYNFYINNKLTYSCKALTSYGFDVGYYISDVTTVLSDHFTVYQKQKKSINLIENSSSFGKKISLGPEINSYANEFSPIISSDEKTLYITRKAHEGNLAGKSDEDIWYSDYNVKDSTWQPVKNIGKPLNNKANNFIQSVSSDNSQVITGNKYDSKGEYSGLGFSISHRTKTGWTIPKDIHIKNYYNNHKYNEICLSPNGQVMLLAIERNDTYGSKDLYVSFINTDSSWTEPKNIGKVINTFADETSPFIAADGTTMYFATAGHPGFGDNDIFLSKRLDDTWLNWSTPKNLGPIINADTWDSYYTVPASGKNAYLVSTVNGNSDIFMIKQPESAKPNPVVLIKGHVFNSETKQPIEAAIHYSELGSKKILGHFKSDPKTGVFILSLPKGKKYSFIADKQDFISVHENIDLVNLKNYAEQELDLYLTPIKKGQSVVINNLFFTANKADILPESFPELDKIIDILKINPRMKILVSGHTSKNNSTAEWNLNLSTNRALSVKNYFLQHGINETRIQHIGYGSEKPINKLAGEANLAKNRRVELEILEH